jgi:hypothetical protein
MALRLYVGGMERHLWAHIERILRLMTLSLTRKILGCARTAKDRVESSACERLFTLASKGLWNVSIVEDAYGIAFGIPSTCVE